MIIEQKNITVERRYTTLRLEPDKPSLQVSYEDGYTDEGVWKVLERGSIALTGDAAGLVLDTYIVLVDEEASRLQDVLNALARSVLLNEFSARAVLRVRATDPENRLLVAHYLLEKDGAVWAEGSGAEVVLYSPVLRNAKLTVQAPGYKTLTVEFPVLAGETEQDFALEVEHE